VSRRVVVGLGLLSLVMVAVLLAVVARTDPSALAPNPTATSEPSLDQQPMLLGVRGRDGRMVDAAVIASRSAGPEATGSMLELQPGLGLYFAEPKAQPTPTPVGSESPADPVAGAAGKLPARTLTLADSGGDSPQTVQARLAGQLGTEIPNGLILDRLAFAALVDVAGGVTVDIPEPIYGRGSAGKRTLLFPAGVQKLQGPAAADYAAYLAPGEDQSERMVRFSRVWAQVIDGLPSDDARMRNVIGSLGALARNSTNVGTMARILIGYQQAQREQALLTGSLPARVVGNGASAVYTPDPVATVAMAQRLFPGAQTVSGVDGVPLRVRLVGAGADGEQLVALSRRLADAGIEVVYGGFAAAQPETTVYGQRKGLGLEAIRQLVADLGLTGLEVRADRTRSAGVSAAIWAGSDVLPSSPDDAPSASSTQTPAVGGGS